MLFNDEILDEDEMFCVFSKLNRKNPPFPYWNCDRIEKQMDDMSSAEIKSEFRFGHSELPLLAEALQIPQYFVCSNGTVASGMEGLRHGRSVPEISLILAEVTDHIYRTNSHPLQDLNQPWLKPQQLESFARAIHQRGLHWVIVGGLWTVLSDQSVALVNTSVLCIMDIKGCTELNFSQLWHRMVWLQTSMDL